MLVFFQGHIIVNCEIQCNFLHSGAFGFSSAEEFILYIIFVGAFFVYQFCWCFFTWSNSSLCFFLLVTDAEIALTTLHKNVIFNVQVFGHHKPHMVYECIDNLGHEQI